MKLRAKFSSEKISGFLDQGTSVTGELRFSGTLRIDGEFHGSITTSDKLIVGERAQIHADIKVGETEVYGKISGNVDSKKRIEIHATGRIQGEVRTPVLVIEEGGVLNGNSNMAAEGNSEELSEKRTPVLVIEEGGVLDGNSNMAGEGKSEELSESPP